MPSQQYNFIITLKEPDYKWIDRVSFLLCLLSSLLFIYFIATGVYIKEERSIVYLIALAIIGAQFGFNYFNKGKYITNNRIAFMAIAICWIIAGNTWLSVLYFVASVLEPKIKFPEEIGFDKDGVTKNTLVKKIYRWNELNNVILKDDVLTIDFKNNSIFQRETQEEVDKDTAKEFNDFCTEYLSALGYNHPDFNP